MATRKSPIGLQNSQHFFIQSEVKPKPVSTRWYTFSRALAQLKMNLLRVMIAGSGIVCLLRDWLDEHFGIGLRHPMENSSLSDL